MLRCCNSLIRHLKALNQAFYMPFQRVAEEHLVADGTCSKLACLKGEGGLFKKATPLYLLL